MHAHEPLADPAPDRAAALGRAHRMVSRDGPEVAGVCHSFVIEPGDPADRAWVLLHGMTSCPQQFAVIADAFAASGCAVVVPRLPGHGMADRLTDAMAHVSAADLATAGHEAVDIAAGLGGRVGIIGLSGGGALAAWLAARRDDIAEAVLVAPLIVPKVVPAAMTGLLSQFPQHGPDINLWWDPRLRDGLATPPYAYPRYSVRLLAAFLQLGGNALPPSRRTRLERLVVVLNDNDGAIDNDSALRLADGLAVAADERVDLRFGVERGFGHDVIDPRGENAQSFGQIYAELGPVLGLPDLVAHLH